MHWIQDTIKPSGQLSCGNHVAARWFSTNTGRFIDFTPPAKDVYQDFNNYTDYVADKFRNQRYIGGGTNTAQALTKTRVEDIPMARSKNSTFVMVFTDGHSSGGLEGPALLLQAAVNEV